MTNKMIKFAIIGTGKFADEYYFPECAKNPQIKLCAIANRSPEKAYEIAQKYQIDYHHVYTGDDGWQTLLENEDIDAVIICTPNRLHAKIAIRAAEKGIHALVEKPMAVTEKEAKAMINSANKNATKLMVAFPQRFMPAFAKAKEIIDSRVLGKINTIHSTFGHAGPETWTRSGKWYFQASQSSGGVLLDLGSHQVDTISWLMGKRITEVSAFLSRLEKQIEVEDNAFLSLKFEGDEMGFISSSWTTKPDPVNNLSAYGEKGSLHLEHNYLKVNSITEKKLYQNLPSTGHAAKAIAVGKLTDNFVRCILTQDEPFISGDDGLISLKVVLNGYQSSYTNSQIKL